MRCKWKEVRNQEKLVEICDRFGRWFLEFSDYSLTLILHEVCGFGQAKRLPDLMDSINPRLNEQMRIYMEDDEEDLWEVTQTTYFGLLRQIRELTEWNPEVVTAEYPVRDLFKPIFGTEKESDRHIFRQNGKHFGREPADTKAADTANEKVGIPQQLGQLLDLVVFHTCGEGLFKLGVLPGFAAGFDDLSVQGCAYKPHPVAVLSCGKCQGRAHHTRADDSDDCHLPTPYDDCNLIIK